MSGKARIGVIGAGWWAVVNHIPVLKALPGLRGGGGQPSRRGRASGGDGEVRDSRAATRTTAQMLAEVPMDGVVISSPHTLHFEHAKAALEKGCHVLVEKPLTTSAADARALVALAAAKGKQIVVPYGWNFRPFAAEARRLAAGVGKIEHVVLQMANALDDLFAGEPMKETEGAMFRPPASTWADPKRAGGFGWGQLVHALGLMFRVADLEPREVFAMTGASKAGVDYYDAAAVRFGNGATGSRLGRRDAAERPAGADRSPHLRHGRHAPPRHRARAGRAPPPRRPRRGDRPRPRRRRLRVRVAAPRLRRHLQRQAGRQPGRRHRRRPRRSRCSTRCTARRRAARPRRSDAPRRDRRRPRLRRRRRQGRRLSRPRAGPLADRFADRQPDVRLSGLQGLADELGHRRARLAGGRDRDAERQARRRHRARRAARLLHDREAFSPLPGRRRPAQHQPACGTRCTAPACPMAGRASPSPHLGRRPRALGSPRPAPRRAGLRHDRRQDARRARPLLHRPAAGDLQGARLPRRQGAAAARPRRRAGRASGRTSPSSPRIARRSGPTSR